MESEIGTTGEMLAQMSLKTRVGLATWLSLPDKGSRKGTGKIAPEERFCTAPQRNGHTGGLNARQSSGFDQK